MATGMDRNRTGATAVPAPAEASKQTAPRQAAPAKREGRSRRRWLMVGMCFFGLTINYIDRSNLSVALVD